MIRKTVQPGLVLDAPYGLPTSLWGQWFRKAGRLPGPPFILFELTMGRQKRVLGLHYQLTQRAYLRHAVGVDLLDGARFPWRPSGFER